MGLALNNIAGELALREQGIARDVLAGDVTVLQQRNRHADLVGLLLLISARYG